MTFLDTGVLVGALLDQHPEHAACLEALEDSEKPFTDAHALAETFATLTGFYKVPAGAAAELTLGLTDHEIPSVLAAAKAAGAVWAGTEVLRLPLAVAPIFVQWLERTIPEKRDKILGRLRAMRGGRLNDARFGSRMRGEGFFADQIFQMFEVACRRAGFPEDSPELSTTAFRRPEGAQLALGL